MNNISNSNIVRNADGLHSIGKEDFPADLTDENNLGVPPQKFKISY